MIDVEEAKRIVMDAVQPPIVEERPLAEALGRFAAEDVRSAHDHPLFDGSAVDGYAFRSDPSVTSWTVVGTVAAGDAFPGALNAGECVRIFTGAMMPAGADTVVMQEHVQRTGDRIVRTDAGLRASANVRRRGEQLGAGAVAFPKGGLLSPAAIGLLASVGTRSVRVAKVPAVRVLVTGDEFAPDAQAVPGRIFSSNDHLLAAALGQERIPFTVKHVPDDAGALHHAVEEAVRDGDIVISTGGASVGDLDLIAPVLRQAEARIHFHGVAQKPGKPMLFASVRGIPFFGLPGNPRAVLVLFWEYVRPFLLALQGAADPWPRSAQLPIADALEVKGGRAEFRAAQVRDGRALLLADEGSHMLRSLIDADALAYLPAGVRRWRAGDPVDVHFLPR